MLIDCTEGEKNTNIDNFPGRGVYVLYIFEYETMCTRACYINLKTRANSDMIIEYTSSTEHGLKPAFCPENSRAGSNC